MATQSSPAFDLMPPPALAARRPMKRAAVGYGETRFEARAHPASMGAVATPATPTRQDAVEPGFWERFDELARGAVDTGWTRTRELGREALASVRSWRKGAAPTPRATANVALPAVADVELLPLVVDAHIADIRRATDGFVRALVALSASLSEAAAARDANAMAARACMIAHFGDELIDEVAHEPSLRRILEMHSKRAHMTPASLDDVMKLVGTEWLRDADAGTGKLVVRSGDGAWELTVDVAFATFRVRERDTGRFVDVDGAAMITRDAHDAFARTHFRIAGTTTP